MTHTPGAEVPNGVPIDSHEEKLIARTLRFKRLAVALVVGFLLVFFAGQAWMAYNTNQVLHVVRDQAVSNHRIAEQNRAISRTIRSCATPNGACSRRGEANRAKAVTTVTQVTLFAVTCAKKPELNTYAQIRACVTAAIGRQPH